MKIAYLIVAHKDPEQLALLVRSLDHPDNRVFVHIDRKASPEDHVRFNEVVSIFEHAEIIPSILVNRCMWSLTYVHIHALEYIRFRNVDFDFFINLSGQDFPLKSQLELHHFLADKAEVNFIEINDPTNDQVLGDLMIRQRNRYIERGGRICKVTDQGRTINELTGGQILLLSGSAWFVLSKSFCDFVLDDPLSYQIQELVQTTFISDETFFQTLFYYSPFGRQPMSLDNLRLIEMDSSTGGEHPRTWTLNDVPKLLQSGKFFARKFDRSVDSDVLHVLSEASK